MNRIIQKILKIAIIMEEIMKKLKEILNKYEFTSPEDKFLQDMFKK